MSTIAYVLLYLGCMLLIAGARTRLGVAIGLAAAFLLTGWLLFS